MRPAVYETTAVCKHLSLLSHIAEMVGRHSAALNAVRKHLCGLRDRCIAAMLATLGGHPQGRDTKAELNRRSQIGEVLTDTGISRRAKLKPLITVKRD